MVYPISRPRSEQMTSRSRVTTSCFNDILEDLVPSTGLGLLFPEPVEDPFIENRKVQKKVSLLVFIHRVI